MHVNRYMKIFADKGLRIFFLAPEILKSFRKKEKNNKNSKFDLGQNPLEIVHGHLYFVDLVTLYFFFFLKKSIDSIDFIDLD